MKTSANFHSVWSATPTPFDDNGRVDEAAVERLVAHHVRLGVAGLFLAGTCGEGAWMPDRERRRLVRRAVACQQLPIAVQVSDNSAARIADNIAVAAQDGADFAVIAPPRFLMNATPDNLLRLYQTAIRASTLPVIAYDLGAHANVFVPPEILPAIYAEPNVVAVKDSSGDLKRRDIALAARAERPDFALLTGDEFHCDAYLRAGYDGLMLGGAAFQGALAVRILSAAQRGDWGQAAALQARMTRLMLAVYGGEKITCWLAGEKYLLTKLGVFSGHFNYLNYPLTPDCRAAIERVTEEEREILSPPIP